MYAGSGYLQSSSLFQCQSSSDQSGLVYTPNIPDFYFNHVKAADFRNNSESSLRDSSVNVSNNLERATHIFTIPPESVSRNCSGSLVSIQYCYRARDRNINNELPIFNLSSLISLNQHGLFEVNNITTISSTPRNSTCTDLPGRIQQICCDTTPLSGLHIPSSEYIFGVTITNPVNVRPLAFRNNIIEYRLRQTSAALGNTGPPQGSRFTLDESNSVNYTHRALLLLRFIIGM